MDFLNDDNIQNDGLTEETKDNFRSLAHWLKINTVLSFVSIIFTIVVSYFSFDNIRVYLGSSMSKFFIITTFINVGISLLLNITLFIAAKYLKLGLNKGEQQSISYSFLMLSNYFKILGALIFISFLLFVIVLFSRQ